MHAILFSSDFVAHVEFRTLCRDPSDDPLLNAAVAARIDCLISGDENLQILGDVEGTPIVSPAEVLRRIKNDRLLKNTMPLKIRGLIRDREVVDS